MQKSNYTKNKSNLNFKREHLKVSQELHMKSEKL